MLQGSAVNVVPVVKGKDRGVTLGESLGTLGFGNPGANVLHDAGTLGDILGRKETLARNA